MTLTEATAALTVPASKANNNCVQDAQWRLRDMLKLAKAGEPGCGGNAAPAYVVKAVNDLRSWL